MAAMTVTQPAIAGTTVTPAAVAASDTITAADGSYILQVINAGASSDVVTITDPGTTPAGSAATNPTVTVVGTTGNKAILLSPRFANSSGVITVAHSFTTSVTYVLYRLG